MSSPPKSAVIRLLAKRAAHMPHDDNWYWQATLVIRGNPMFSTPLCENPQMAMQYAATWFDGQTPETIARAEGTQPAQKEGGE